MDEHETFNKKATRSIAMDLLTQSLALIIGIIVVYLLGLKGLTGQIVAILATLAVAFILLRIDWFGRQIKAYAPAIFALLLVSIILNIRLVQELSGRQIHNGILPVESIPSQVMAYQGRDTDGDAGSGWLTIKRTEEGNTSYQFQYMLPDTEYGYAGYFFAFSKPENLTEYDFLELTMRFETHAVCNLYIIDNDNGKEFVRLGDNELI